jgi:hypothetical protein
VACPAAGQTGQVADQQEAQGAEDASGQTVERTVDDSGNILETTLNENGEVIGEDLVGNVADLPVEDEYIDEQGQVVSRVRDDAGNTFDHHRLVQSRIRRRREPGHQVIGSSRAIDGGDRGRGHEPVDDNRVVDHRTKLFHVTLIECAGSARMDRIYPAIQEEMQLCLAQLSESYPGPGDLAAEHRVLLDAVGSGDVDRAVKAMLEHLERSLQDLSGHLMS